ncbi:hypothetical protein I4F81_004098 [Pyropia yezoensis]|uniref:Uncharacterized protein n=1 Tax=Pyropia yezoensis TaxID=2788 RepID=A0ACC3BTZ1_PYRYE|nr:hypothetical protein I4F81_004098 [Neopyropia yezoensis]
MFKVGKYILLDTVGEGSFGKVKLGLHEDTGVRYAVKIMAKSRISTAELTIQVRREVAVMKALRHKNIVRLYEVLTSSKHIYLVMELVTGGELFDIISDRGRLSEAEGRSYFQQLELDTSVPVSSAPLSAAGEEEDEDARRRRRRKGRTKKKRLDTVGRVASDRSSESQDFWGGGSAESGSIPDPVLAAAVAPRGGGGGSSSGGVDPAPGGGGSGGGAGVKPLHTPRGKRKGDRVGVGRTASAAAREPLASAEVPFPASSPISSPGSALSPTADAGDGSSGTGGGGGSVGNGRRAPAMSPARLFPLKATYTAAAAATAVDGAGGGPSAAPSVPPSVRLIQDRLAAVVDDLDAVLDESDADGHSVAWAPSPVAAAAARGGASARAADRGRQAARRW